MATPTHEIERLGYDIGYIRKMDEWKDTIMDIGIDEINEKKKKIAQIKNEFSWDTTLSCRWLDEI